MSPDLYFRSVIFVAHIECRVQICFSSMLPFFNQHNNFFSVTMKSDFESVRYVLFYFVCPRFMSGAPLVTVDSTFADGR